MMTNEQDIRTCMYVRNHYDANVIMSLVFKGIIVKFTQITHDSPDDSSLEEIDLIRKIQENNNDIFNQSELNITDQNKTDLIAMYVNHKHRYVLESINYAILYFVQRHYEFLSQLVSEEVVCIVNYVMQIAGYRELLKD